MNAIIDCDEVVDLNNNHGDLNKAGPIVALGATSRATSFDVPLSIFYYKGYDSDFFTSWYNVSSRIFKEINTCPEKKVLNLALSTLMLPYIAFAALGLVIYSRFKTNKASLEESKTKKSEVSESMLERLAYGILATVVVFINIAILVALFIPGTLALATFYLLNRKLSHSLIAALKISSESCQSKCKSIKVSFHETEVDKPEIIWGVEIKFPPQFKQLLKNLYGDEDDRWFSVTRDSEHNTILKLSANIRLENGLKPLHSEIRNILALSIQEFAKTMEEFLRLEGDNKYDKLKDLLSKFRLKVADSIGPKVISYLIQDAHRVAFIQMIKIAQTKRKGGFLLEEELKSILVKQELESQGKELPCEKAMIIKDLKELQEASDLADIVNSTNEDDLLKEPPAKIDDISNDALPVFKAKWEQLIEKGKIAKKTAIDVYKDVYLQETEKALCSAEKEIENLKRIGQKRFDKICEELKEVYENRKNDEIKDNALKRKLEGLFKCEYDNQEVEQKLIESRIKAIQVLLNRSDDKVKQSLAEDFSALNEIKTSDKVNEFITQVYLEITKYQIRKLFEEQTGDVKGLCNLFQEDKSDLADMITSNRKEVEGYLTQPALLREKIEKQNKDLDDKKNGKEESPNMKLIELCLKNNQEILKALGQLESEKERLLINEKTKSDCGEELTSREKIKFAIIEDKLLEVLKEEIFDGAKIKKLLEEVELECCLAEKCIKYPMIKTKDNIKHFCRDLLSPLINRLVENIISNVPKDNQNIVQKVWNSLWTGLGYVKVGLSATVINKDGSIEGKALSVVHDTYKEVDALLKYFESNYEEVGDLVGNVFSDDGKTLKNKIWPKLANNLREIWNRFFKDIEFTLVSKDKPEDVSQKLDKVSLIQLQQVLAV